MQVAVVFTSANRRAGVERVAWDLCHYLASRHDTTFVGLALEHPDLNGATFRQVAQTRGLPRLVGFRRAAERALEELDPDVVLSLGACCPAGDVLWVQSVHRAFIDRSQGPVVRGRQAPRWARTLLPRHQLILHMERQYFAAARPRTILCTSSQEQADLGRHYAVAPGRCRIVPNGYDPTIFDPGRRAARREAARRRLGLRPDELSLLFVANELHRKGFGTLIAALARANLPAARLDVVGRVSPGDYGPTIRRLGLDGAIRWHGPTRDVSSFYAAADVLVLPTQYEPFGIVIVEALASGVPVVASRLAGASSAVESRGGGRLLDDPTDPDELARCLREAADPTVRAQWASAAPAGATPYAWPLVLVGVEQVLVEAGRSRRGVESPARTGREAGS